MPSDTKDPGLEDALGLSEDERFAARVRAEWGVTRKVFARLSGYSERSLAQWEAGERLTPPARRTMNELLRLHQRLARLIDPKLIGSWLERPNQKVFGGMTPLQVIESGEIDRIWEVILSRETARPT
jgi:hypothetical protein